MFDEVWFVDFEYYAPPGELPLPLCLAAYEKYSKRRIRLSLRDFPHKPPYSVASDAVFVSFAADAELLCHHVLGWPFPNNVIDLHVEYLNYSNYLEREGPMAESSLLAVLTHFRIDHVTSAVKESGRLIAMRGGPRTPEEETTLLDYCQTDVAPLEKLFDRLIGPGNIYQAIERGRYMKAVSLMQATGTPIDVSGLQEFRDKWESIKWRLVSEVDRDFGVFDGVKFSSERFKGYLAQRRIPWPLSPAKQSDPDIRNLFKIVALGIQYSMGVPGLAQRINKPLSEAETLLSHHKNQFPNFWIFADRAVTTMEFKRVLSTKSGWRVIRRQRAFPARWRRSAQNWLIQSTGADLLRRVCCLVTENKIKICAPVHDAIVIEDSVDRIEQTAADTQDLMKQACREVLGGFEIKIECTIFPERFYDKRGVQMWHRVNQLMAQCKQPQLRLFDEKGSVAVNSTETAEVYTGEQR